MKFLIAFALLALTACSTPGLVVCEGNSWDPTVSGAYGLCKPVKTK